MAEVYRRYSVATEIEYLQERIVCYVERSERVRIATEENKLRTVADVKRSEFIAVATEPR